MSAPSRSPTPAGPLAFLAAVLGGVVAFSRGPSLAGLVAVAACAAAGVAAAWLARRSFGRFVPLFLGVPGILATGSILRARSGEGTILAVAALVGCGLALAVLIDRARRPSREGSLLDVFERRRGAVVALALSSIVLAVAEALGRFHGLAFLGAFSLAIGTLLFAGANARTLLDLSTLARGLSRAPELTAPYVDFGVGDEVWSESQPSAPYRANAARGARAAFGDYVAVHRAMAGGVLAEWALFVVVGVVCALAIPRPRYDVACPSCTAPAPVVQTQVVTTTVEAREAGWYPQRGPILVDLNDDGVEDIVGVRWLYGDEEKGVTVMAVDGATFKTMWRVTPSIASQWSSGRVSLVKSGGTLFLSDSEGLLHVFALKDGARVGRPIDLPPTARLVCAAKDGEPRAWLSKRTTEGGKPQGLLVDATGTLTEAVRPDWCLNDGQRSCDSKGTGPCWRYDVPMTGVPANDPGAYLSVQNEVEDEGFGVAIGTLIEKESVERRAYLAGYEAKTKKVTWQTPFQLTDDSMHEDAYPHIEVQHGRVLGLYQLASGRWLVGARDARSGDVEWSTDVPRAVHGTNFETMTVSDARVYLALSSRLEIFDLASGKSLGVVW